MTKTKNNKRHLGRDVLVRLLLLILSFVIAVVLWYIGTLQDQTPISRAYTDIPVEFINGDSLGEFLLTAKDLGDVKVDMVLKGVMSDMSNIDENALVAVIDLREFDESGEFSVSPSVRGCSERIEVTDIDFVDIKIERLITKQLTIGIETTGVPADGYYVDSANITFEKYVNATCGESISMNVVSAKVVIDVSDRKNTYDVNLNIILLDTKGMEINNSKITLEHYSVNVTVPVMKYEE